MNWSYLVIISIVIFTASVGRLLNIEGLKNWYPLLKKPEWTPKGSTIALIWAVIYIFSTVAAIIVWNEPMDEHTRNIIKYVFLINALLNALWSFVFFKEHLLFISTAESAVLGVTVLVLIALILQINIIAALLLVPYFFCMSKLYIMALTFINN